MEYTVLGASRPGIEALKDMKKSETERCNSKGGGIRGGWKSGTGKIGTVCSTRGTWCHVNRDVSYTTAHKGDVF